MSLNSSLSLRLRTGLVAAVALGVVAVPAYTAVAVPAAPTDASACAHARAAVAEARAQRATALKNLAKARATLKKAKADRKPAKVRAAKKTVDRVSGRQQALGRLVNARLAHANALCAAPNSVPRAIAAGSVLGLLTQANGVDLGVIDAGQLTDLLDGLLPGLSSKLTPAQLGALLAGYNAFASGDVDPADLLAVLGSAFSADDVLALLDGVAGTEVLTELSSTLLGQVQGLLGGDSLPSLTDLLADPAGLLEALTGTLLPTLCGIVPIPLLCS